MNTKYDVLFATLCCSTTISAGRPPDGVQKTIAFLSSAVTLIFPGSGAIKVNNNLNYQDENVYN